MKVIVFFVAFAFLIGSALCETLFNNTVLDSMVEVPEKVKEEIAVRITNFTDAVEHKWEIVHDLMDGADNDTFEPESEEPEIDATGCNRKQRKHFEDRCDDSYEKVNDEAQMIEDESERIEAVCCALEDYEKCSLRAYDQANCGADTAALRKSIMAARLFLTVIANVTCSEFRGSDLCETQFNDTALDSMEGVSENINGDVAIGTTNFTNVIERKGNIFVVIDEDDDETAIANSKEPEDDYNGCNGMLIEHFQNSCLEVYEEVNEETDMIENERERIKSACCALEDYETCSVRAYDKANCVIDKTVVIKKFRAARPFLTVIASLTCEEFSGQCDYYSAASTVYASYTVLFISFFVMLSLQKESLLG